MTPEAILLAIAAVVKAWGDTAEKIAASQTEEQRKKAWDRYFEVTEAAHKLTVKMLNKMAVDA